MSKKRSKGTRLDLSSFNSVGGYGGSSSSDLPTGPSGRSREEIEEQRNARSNRYDDRDEPSRADDSSKWRRGGRGGGGGFGGREESGFRSNRSGFGGGREESGFRSNRGGGREESGFRSNRGGGGEESGFRSNRGGGGDDKWGRGGSGFGGGRGGDSRGGSGFGGGRDRYGGGFRDNRDDRQFGGGRDERPAYLRMKLKKRGEAPDPVPKKAEPKVYQAKPKKEEHRRRRVDDPDAPKREIDESLAAVSTVTVDKRETNLEKALLSNEPVTEDDLLEGLAGIDLNKSADDLASVLSKSVLTKSVTIENVFSAVKEEVKEGEVELLIQFLQSAKEKLGERTLAEGVRASKEVDVLATVAKGLEGDALHEFLTSKDLLCIEPVPDLSAHVGEALDKGTSGDDIVKHINTEVDVKLSVVTLAPVVTSKVLEKVFADKANPSAEVLSSYKSLLQRVLVNPPDEKAQVDLLFAAQEAWFAAGKDKAFAKTLFSTLHSDGIVDPVCYVTWRDDTKRRSKAKGAILLRVNSFIDEIQVREIYDEDEGDYYSDELEDFTQQYV